VWEVILEWEALVEVLGEEVDSYEDMYTNYGEKRAR